jgi:hypothetical protein
MTTTAEKILVMQAFEDGAKIERSRRKGLIPMWEDTTIILWDWIHHEYRVKQEPKTMTRWVNVNRPTDCAPVIGGDYHTKEHADDMSSSTRIACVPVTITYVEGEGLE